MSASVLISHVTPIPPSNSLVVTSRTVLYSCTDLDILQGEHSKISRRKERIC